jgi:hypothetical protein
MPVRLNPLLPATADAILVGDPRRAFTLGQSLTVQPQMSHLSRGLWGYSGVTEGGLDLTVQATGIGGPSAVAVISELAGFGVKRIVRLGSCVATGPDDNGEVIEPGRAFVISRAIAGDGASQALTGGRRVVRPDSTLNGVLTGVADPSTVFSHDLTLKMDGPPDRSHPLRDLQTAATLAAAGALEVESAAVLVVVEDTLGNRLEEAELEAAFEPIGSAIVRALEQLANPQLQG